MRHIPAAFKCGEAGQGKTHYLSVNREYYSLFSLLFKEFIHAPGAAECTFKD